MLQGIKSVLEQSKKISKTNREFSGPGVTAQPKSTQSSAKRAAAPASQTVCKKPKMNYSFKDVSLAEAGKYGTLNEFAFFDKVSSSFKLQITSLE